MTGKTVDSAIGKLTIVRLLGKGKSGYSYLAENETGQFVLKIMHDEPVAYYSFHDKKVTLERDAYNRLSNLNIRIPALITFDHDRQFLIKEYIEGKVASEYIADGSVSEAIIRQLFEISASLKNHGYNIDWFPSNFVVRRNDLFYIDYETNAYSTEWSFENWGVYYWANSAGMKDYLATGNASAINEFPDKGLPFKTPFEHMVKVWKEKYLR